MQSARAFAPANLSCIFVIRKTKNPAKSGSLGMGFTVNKGVFATITKINNNKKIPIIKKCNIKKIIKNNNENNKNVIYYNSKKINFPTVNSVIKKLTNEKVKVNIKSELPLGCGFGLSGASALATAYALNKLFNLKKSRKELAMAAHIAEVENATGLGDVVNKYYGGFCVKLETSANFQVKKLPIAASVYCRYFSPIETKSVIQNEGIRNRINDAAGIALGKITTLI